MKSINYKKYLLKPINLTFYSNHCLINGILANYNLKFKKNMIFNNKNTTNIFIIKTYFRTFFTLLLKIIDGISFGYKSVLKLKGKGLRIQLKKKYNSFLIYLKLGYSHKIFFKLPSNFWIYVYERRRSLIFYSLNYPELRTILLKIRSYYPVNLYKLRGFFEPTEKIKQKKGKSRLGSGANY